MMDNYGKQEKKRNADYKQTQRRVRADKFGKKGLKERIERGLREGQVCT